MADVGKTGADPRAFEIVREPIRADAVLARVRRPGCGAVVVFHGTVRGRTGTRRVRYLEYEAYEPMALAQMAAVADAVSRAHGLEAVACVHRVGRLEVGEDAMVVAVASPHRAAALAGVEAFIGRLKREVPIWKKEVFEGGEAWIGTPDDPQGERAAPGRTTP